MVGGPSFFIPSLWHLPLYQWSVVTTPMKVVRQLAWTLQKWNVCLFIRCRLCLIYRSTPRWHLCLEWHLLMHCIFLRDQRDGSRMWKKLTWVLFLPIGILLHNQDSHAACDDRSFNLSRMYLKHVLCDGFDPFANEKVQNSICNDKAEGRFDSIDR